MITATGARDVKQGDFAMETGVAKELGNGEISEDIAKLIL